MHYLRVAVHLSKEKKRRKLGKLGRFEDKGRKTKKGVTYVLPVRTRLSRGERWRGTRRRWRTPQGCLEGKCKKLEFFSHFFYVVIKSYKC